MTKWKKENINYDSYAEKVHYDDDNGDNGDNNNNDNIIVLGY